jgi:hypothetical protein
MQLDVEAARAAIGDPRARFVVAAEVTDDADYVIASGALSVRPGVGDEEWAEYVRGALRGLWERARRGLAFNMLPRRAEPADPDVFTTDPQEWAQWSMRELPGSQVALFHGPPLRDFSVLVRRAR